MSLHITRRDSDRSRDPFGLARELLGWDPFHYGRAGNTFAPTFEVKETAEAFVVRADLPGVKDADLDVSVHNGVLSVSGSRAAEQRQEGDSYYVYERQFGSFSRSFGLPESADPDRVEARLEQGVLHLTIGKKVQAKPRKIELKKA
jgi:HSP20 family protein